MVQCVRCLVTLALSLLVAPLLAIAQPAGQVPKIGMLITSSATATTRNFEAFTQGLRELGYIEGQNLAIERRFAEGRLERLPALATELATLNIKVFVVQFNRVAEAVQQTTTQIPIVMIAAEEPVSLGLAKSLAHPGGTITGLTIVPGTEIYGKNLELLTEVLPPGARIGVLFNATAPVNALWLQATEEAARGLGVTLVPAGVRSTEDFEHAVTVMHQGNARGFVVLGEPLFTTTDNIARINELAVRSGLAAMWPGRIGAEAGGLIPLPAAPDARRSCAKRSLALLVGWKSPPGKVSPTTRTECCVGEGGARTPPDSYAAYPGPHGGPKGRRTSRQPTQEQRVGARREGLPGSSGRGRQGEQRRALGSPWRGLGPPGAGQPSRPPGGRLQPVRESARLIGLRAKAGAGRRQGLPA